MNAPQCWLTQDVKTRCWLQAEHLSCLGMGLLSSLLKLFVKTKKTHQLHISCRSLQRCFKGTLTNHNPWSQCASPPVLVCAIYACCHSRWVANRCRTRTCWNNIYLLKRNCLFLYTLMRTSTPPTTKQTTNGTLEVTDVAYLAYVWLVLEWSWGTLNLKVVC